MGLHALPPPHMERIPLLQGFHQGCIFLSEFFFSLLYSTVCCCSLFICLLCFVLKIFVYTPDSASWNQGLCLLVSISGSIMSTVFCLLEFMVCLLNECISDRMYETGEHQGCQHMIHRQTSLLPLWINDSESRKPTSRDSLFCVIKVLTIPLEAPTLERMSC